MGTRSQQGLLTSAFSLGGRGMRLVGVGGVHSLPQQDRVCKTFDTEMEATRSSLDPHS